jgi:hypothetical protein
MQDQARESGGRLIPALGWAAVALAWGGIALLLFGGLPGHAARTAPAITVPVPVSEEHASLDGIIEQTGAGPVLVSGTSGKLLRVPLRVDAASEVLTPVRAWELLAGISVEVSVRTGPDRHPLGTSVRLGSPSSVLPPPSPDPALFTGLIAHYDGVLLRLLTQRGEEWVRMAPDAELLRVTPLRTSTLQPGQRVLVDGQRLADGSLTVRSLALR